METAYFIKKMKEEFSRKQRDNPSYSLRAYARDLKVHPSTLSQILLGKRPLPFKNATYVVERLNLGAKERTLFMESLARRHVALDQIHLPNTDDRFMLDEAYFQIIAEWEHYALLTLFDCEGFEPSIEQIASRLGITGVRAQVVLENLIQYGLLKKTEDETLVKSHSQVRTTEDIASHALRASHRETQELGKKKLDEVAVELRDFSSMMVALDLEKLPEAKAIIREFRQKMKELVKVGEREHVYQLAIQFYPLTQIETDNPRIRKTLNGGKYEN